MDRTPLSAIITTKLSCAIVFLLLFAGNSDGKQCGNCGAVVVPYPLSTSPDCGDPNYPILCNTTNGQLYFQSVNGSSYPIISIDTSSQKFVVRPAPFVGNTCATDDLHHNGMTLNRSLPFNLTGDNTFMYLNCVPRLLQTPLDCSNTSLCWTYVRQMPEAAPCRNMNICCTAVTGGSATAAGFRLSSTTGCTAYRSYVGLDWSLPIQQWPPQGLELQWRLPLELGCRNQTECVNAVPNSKCTPDPMAPMDARGRCYCDNGFRWNAAAGTCVDSKMECLNAGSCRPNHLPLIIGLTITAVALLLIMVSSIFLYKKNVTAKEAKTLAKEREEMLSSNGGRSAKLFTGKEMKKATDSFCRDNFLGSGGFGEVFRGILDNGTVVAVKTAKVGNTKSVEQVLNEVRILSQVNHRNLLRLLGCCVELQQPLMVYEFISNGNLYDHLHGDRYGFLTWRQRLAIAYQTAEALAYLHSSAFPPIYHRDIKSSNILLDETLNAKVSDFGLSRLVETDLSHISTCAQGTLGYLDPEYYRNFQLTDKSDVYSFGVVLLELLSSKKVIDFNRGLEEANLVLYMQNRATADSSLIEEVDGELRVGASEEALDTMKALACLAMACLEERRQHRPSMKEVAEEIAQIVSVHDATCVVILDHMSSCKTHLDSEEYD